MSEMVSAEEARGVVEMFERYMRTRHPKDLAALLARTVLALRRAHADPMAAPHVDVCVPIHGGSVRLSSASGGLESLWITLSDHNDAEVVYDRATGKHVPAAVRLTPAHARTLADLLRRYADTHRETA